MTDPRIEELVELVHDLTKAPSGSSARTGAERARDGAKYRAKFARQECNPG